MSPRRVAVGLIRAGALGSMLFIGLAGAAKLLALDEFWLELTREHRLAHGVADVVAVALPSLEVLIAGVWLLTPWRRIAALAGLVLLAALSGYLVHAMHAEAPPASCGCLGLLARHAQWTQSLEIAIARNTAMMAFLGLWLVCRSARIRSRAIAL